MNIAIIAPEYPPNTNWGGVATFNYHLSRLLALMGHNVHVITFCTDKVPPEHPRDEAIQIHYIRYRDYSKTFRILYFHIPFFFRYYLKSLFPNILFIIDWNIFSLICFRKLHRIHAFDAVHSVSYLTPAFLIHLFYPGVRHIVHIQSPQENLDPYETVTRDRKIKSYIEYKYIKHSSDYNISCSKDVLTKIKYRYPDVRTKTEVIYNFILPEEYYNINPVNPFSLVFIGRLEYRKGVDMVVSTFNKIARKNKEIKLWLIGDIGSYFPYQSVRVNFSTWLSLQRIPDSIRNRIFILPRIDDRITLISLLKKLKGIAILPSRYEPFGYVYIEAMAAGYVVLASNNGGGREIIKHGENGYLVNPTEESIYAQLNSIFRLSQQKLKLLSRHAQYTVRSNFSYAVVRPLYSKIYNFGKSDS